MTQRSKFWDLLEESVIFQGLLVVLIAGTVCIMYLREQAVPDALLLLVGTIVTYFFEQKSRVAERRTVQYRLEKGKDRFGDMEARLAELERADSEPHVQKGPQGEQD